MTPLAADNSERAVLAACILVPDRLAFLGVETAPEDFTGPYRPRLRDLLLSLAKQEAPLSFELLESAYKATHRDASVGVEIDLIRTEVTPHAWSYHVGQIRAACTKRRLVKGTELLQKAILQGDDEGDILALVQNFTMVASGFTPRDALVVAGDDLTAEVKTEYFQGKSGYLDLGMGPRIYPFRGVRPGEVFTVLARTWVGKSLWASQAAINAMVPTLVVSMEMPRIQWWERTIMQTIGAKDSIQRLATGQIAREEYALLAPVQKRIALADQCDGSLVSLEAAIKRSEKALKAHPRLVVVDYLQLLNFGRATTLYQKASEIAVEIKRLAKRAQVAIMLLSQVGRKDGTDGSTEVTLESARDSGQIEEAADFVLGLWRPCQKRGLSREEYELLRPQIRGRLLKNRRGGAFEWNFELQMPSLRVLAT